MDKIDKNQEKRKEGRGTYFFYHSSEEGKKIGLLTWFREEGKERATFHPATTSTYFSKGKGKKREKGCRITKGS